MDEASADEDRYVAAAGVVAAVTGSASAQRVCVDIVIDVNGHGTAQHICLPE
jgi:hypothetical protein